METPPRGHAPAAIPTGQGPGEPRRGPAKRPGPLSPTPAPAQQSPWGLRGLQGLHGQQRNRRLQNSKFGKPNVFDENRPLLHGPGRKHWTFPGKGRRREAVLTGSGSPPCVLGIHIRDASERPATRETNSPGGREVGGPMQVFKKRQLTPGTGTRGGIGTLVRRWWERRTGPTRGNSGQFLKRL